MKKIILLAVVFMLLISSVNAQNILQNADFSKTTGSEVEHWTTDSYVKDDSTIFEVIPADKALKITVKSENHAYAMQEVTVEKGKYYRFSAKVKTESVGESGNGALLSLYYLIAYSNEVKGTSREYQPVEMYFYSDTEKVPVILSLGGYSRMNTGTAYFKDVEITQVDAVPKGAKLYQKKAAETTAPAASTQANTKRSFDYSWVFMSIFLAALIAVCLYYLYKK